MLPSIEKPESYLEDRRVENRRTRTISGIPRPVLKWAGGKRQLLGQLDEFIPKRFDAYLEPFVGGGAMFFYLLPRKAILIDINPELINVYKVIKENVEELIESLKKHVNEKEYYYSIRALDRDPDKYSALSDVERASRTIYLNRCCYNGLYRVNSKNQFNVPFGRYKNPRICDEENLRMTNILLQDVEIYCDSFERCLDFAKKGDFVYLDPPYVPISETAYFTSYSKDNFGRKDQERLRDVFVRLDEIGCKVMLSNSYHDLVLDLYQEWRKETIFAGRAINSDGTKRGKIKEVLVLNY